MPADALTLGRRLMALPRPDLARLMAEAPPDEQLLIEEAVAAVDAERQARAWMRDPVAWAAACLDLAGSGLTPYQADALATLATDKRLAVRSLHGAGKTAIAALALLHFSLTRNAAGVEWKVPTTASVHRQLLHYLWPEVHKWARRLRWDVVGRTPFTPLELQVTRLRLSRGEAWAMSSNDPAALEGAHAEHLLFIFDEAKAIPDGIFDAAEGAFAGAGDDTAQEAYALAISTPGEPAGRFYQIHRRARGTENWRTRHVTLADAVAAGRVSADWAASTARMWPPGSAVYRNRVLGEFASSGLDTVIPLEWVEAANERWHALVASGRISATTHIGVDVARTGDDATVICAVAGEFVGVPIRPGPGDSRHVAAHTLRLAGMTGPGPLVIIDADGVGSGVYDELRHHPQVGPRVRAFHAAAAAPKGWMDSTRQLAFANLRAAASWLVRDQLDPRLGPTLALPPDDLLTGDLTTPRWRLGHRGTVLIESKDEIRKRLGRSCDSSDALMIARWGQIIGTLGAVNSEAHTSGGAMITAGVMTEQA